MYENRMIKIGGKTNFSWYQRK